MSNLIERAKAAIEAAAEHEYADGTVIVCPRAAARAVIETMLDPTPMMEMRASNLRLPVRLDQIRDLYQAMIKEAAK